jgi:hypothetical protein
MEEIETKKRRKPRTPNEVIDLPRRYLVRSEFSENRIVQTESRADARGAALDARLMGTHEDQAHAEKRLGW